MQHDFNYPEFLENKRVADSDIAHAYDILSSTQRAHIKNGIAFNHFLHKERANKYQTMVDDHAKGYMYSLQKKPVAWTILFFTHTYLSAPRMIAALMPALLAKVPLVLAISLNGLPSNNALTALELMGIEDIFCMNNDKSHLANADEALKIIKTLQEFNINGRVLFMHNNELSTIVQKVLTHNIICWQEDRPPKLALQKNCKYTEEYFTWAYPDTFCTNINYDCENAEALLCSQDFYNKNKNKLANIKFFLFEGMEGCWTHTNLRPEFFQQTNLCIGKSEIDSFE